MNIIAQRYELLDTIGKGGMGVVYQVHDRLTGEMIALKQFITATHSLAFNSLTTNADQNVALANEFQTLARLRHPHIISVLDYGFDAKQQPYFTMNYLASAHTIIRAGRDKDSLGKIDLITQLLQALAYLHRHGIVHRDLKPGNILVEGGEHVRVLDFGLAAEVNRAQDTAGTIHYMAPEILQGETASFASDLYAVGMLIYELFSGKNPFHHKTITEVVRAILNSTLDVAHLSAIDFTEMMPTPTGNSTLANTAVDTLSLAGIIERLTDKDPAKRYPDANSVIRDLSLLIGEPMPAETQAIRESFLQAAKFVGRDSELNQLTSALDTALAGQGSLWLVGGESGVGKSRVLDELRTYALVKGALVTRGFMPAQGGLSYQLWRNLLPSLVLAVDIDDHEASILHEVIPHISQLIGKTVQPASSLLGTEGQARLIHTIQDVFKRLPQPVVVLVEDLQWADESLEPLNQLASILENHSILIVGSYRNDEVPNLPEKLPSAQVIELARLNQDDIAELSISMLGDSGKNPNVLEIISQETQGNTYFIVEVVRALAEHAGSLAQVGNATLPNGILDGGMHRVIELRLQRMARHTHILNLAATIGLQIDIDLLRHLLPNEDIDAWLYLGSDIGILAGEADAWHFVHDQLRTISLGKLEDAQRQALHRQVALGIEAIRNQDEYAEILMNHWREAGDMTQELIYLEKVTQQLVHYSARYATAQELITRGLGINPESTHLWKLQGDLHRLMAKYDEAQTAYEKMLAVASTLDNKVAQIEAKLGLAEANLTLGHYESTQQLGQEALALSQKIDAKKQMASAHNVMGVSHKHLGQYETAIEQHKQALAIQQDLEDKAGLAITLNELGGVYNVAGKYQQGLEYTERGLAYHQELGNRRGTAVTLTNVGTMAHGVNDVERAKSSWAQALAIFREIGDPYGIANTLNFLALVIKDDEGFEKAKAYQDEALSIYREIGDTLGLALGLINLGFNLNGEELYAEAKPYLIEALEIGRTIQHPLILAYTLQELVNTNLALKESYEGYLKEGLQLVQEMNADRAKAVMFISLLVIQYETANHEKAAEYVGFLLNYEGTPGDQYDFIIEMGDKIKEKLAEDVYLRATTHGQTIDIDQVITETLQALEE